MSTAPHLTPDMPATVHPPEYPLIVTNSTTPIPFELIKDERGQWCLQVPHQEPMTVHAVRSFALSAPDEAIALVGSDGHERLHISRLHDLAPSQAQAVREALAERDFFPQILRLREVSTFATPSIWKVDTDRGPTELVLKGEEDIRRLQPRTRLLITSAHGVVFEIADMTALDRHSRRWLERFL